MTKEVKGVKRKKMLDPEKPLFMPSGSIRDLIALIFSVAVVFISYSFMTNENINKDVFNVFVNFAMIIIGYYFGNRKP